MQIMDFKKFQLKRFGYYCITTLWEDFSHAEDSGVDAIKEVYDKARDKYKKNVQARTELTIVLYHKSWQHYANRDITLSLMYSEWFLDSRHDNIRDFRTSDSKNYYYNTTGINTFKHRSLEMLHLTSKEKAILRYLAEKKEDAPYGVPVQQAENELYSLHDKGLIKYTFSPDETVEASLTYFGEAYLYHNSQTKNTFWDYVLDFLSDKERLIWLCITLNSIAIIALAIKIIAICLLN